MARHGGPLEQREQDDGNEREGDHGNHGAHSAELLHWSALLDSLDGRHQELCSHLYGQKYQHISHCSKCINIILHHSFFNLLTVSLLSASNWQANSSAEAKVRSSRSRAIRLMLIGLS